MGSERTSEKMDETITESREVVRKRKKSPTNSLFSEEVIKTGLISFQANIELIKKNSGCFKERAGKPQNQEQLSDTETTTTTAATITNTTTVTTTAITTITNTTAAATGPSSSYSSSSTSDSVVPTTGSYRCLACSKPFVSTARYVTHMKLHLASLPYCKLIETRGFLRPKETHHCQSCHYRTDRKSVLSLHKRTHHSAARSDFRLHACDSCSSAFSHKAILARHRKLHSRLISSKRVAAPAAAPAAAPDSLDDDEVLRLNTSSAPTTATRNPVRASKTAASEKLRRVSFTVETATKYGYGSSKSKKRQRKEAKKTKTRNFICKICKHAFDCRPRLTTHERCHESVKAFKCSVCPFWSGHNGCILHHEKHVHQHKRLVTPKPNKPAALLEKGEVKGVIIKCSLCLYQTEASWHMKRHMKSHTDGVKKYKCSQCPFWSESNGNVSNHQRKYH